MDLDNLPYILFFADRHSYVCRSAETISATTLIGKYKWEFERDYWLTSGAIKQACPDVWRTVKDRNYKGLRKAPKSFFLDCFHEMTPEQRGETKAARKDLEWQWEIKNAVACYRGTKFHAKMELKDLRSKKGAKNPVTGVYQKVELMPDTTYSDNASILPKLSDLPDGFYPELLIFIVINGVCICGQVDRAWLWTDENGERWYTSDDWKTNWEKRKKPGMNTFKSFLTHMRTTKNNEYALQASIYAYIMELWGFNIAQFQITYVKDFDTKTKEVVELPYLKEEVEQMFNDHFNNHEK